MTEEALFARSDESDLSSADELSVPNTSKYLIFLSGGIYYGVNADYVAEIITETSITSLPLLPRHIRGIINIRGGIVPIVDFGLLLGYESKKNACIVVLDIADAKLGILVDMVEQIVDINKASIRPVPYQSEKDTQKMICGMCTLPDDSGTLMLLDCELLPHG